MAKRHHKPHRTAMEAATKALEKAEREQCAIIYAAAALALSRGWGRGKKAILSVFETTMAVWHECTLTDDKSMLRMCEDETGIEVQCGDGKSWHDIVYLNGSLRFKQMTFAQWTYMRQQQLKWIAPQVVACIMIALHRKYGFGFDRLSRLYGQMDAIRAQYNEDPKTLLEQCRQEVEINIYDVITNSEYGRRET